MGDIYREMGDLEKADEYYVKMISKNVDRTDKFTDLAEMYHKELRKLQSQSRKMKKDAKALNDPIQAAYAKANECAKA